MEQQIALILGGLILAGILWVAKGTADNKTSLAVLNEMVLGVKNNIESTVMPEIGRLRDAAHSVRDGLQGVTSRHDLLAQRFETWEGTDRRSGIDRRESSNG